VTFRQVLSALARQWILIVIVVVVAVGIAGVFVVRQAPSYSSTISNRLSTLAAGAASSGQIGNTQVDFNPESITSPTVLAGAARLLHEPATALDGAISYSAGSGLTANQLGITALAPTSAEAMARANAVTTSYNTYLEGQTKLALTGAQTQETTAAGQAEAYQAQLAKNASDVLAQAGLQSALSQVNSANSTIQKIGNAGPPVTIVAQATPGEFKGVEPKIALLVALVAGLVAGLGIALIRDQFDNRLRGESELDQVAGVPSLGPLNLDKQVARRKERLPTADRRRTPLAEDLRSLRTTLQVLLPAHHAAVVFTSVEPGEGKTFVSANLALAWAKAGREVVLVGGDLRRPTLDEYFGAAAEGPGLAELLQRAAEGGQPPSQRDVEAYLQATDYPGLRVLPSGKEPAAPADLLATSAVTALFASLRSACDIVIVDSPPAMALVDASLLASHADGAVMIASVGRTNRNGLAETVDALVGGGVTVLGAVANRARRRIPTSYGAYYGKATGRRSARTTDALRPAGAGVPESAAEAPKPIEE
jgi:succinoglycan biosynthesis transport protein ExoP